jgi:uncharacterized protein YjaZ
MGTSMNITKYFSYYVILFIIIVLSNCDLNYPDTRLKTIEFSQSDQNFTIVSFYHNTLTYVEKAKQNRNNIKRFYKKHVYNPIWRDFASKGEFSFLAKSIKYPIKNIEALEKEIEGLTTSGIENIVKQSLLKISEVLPGPNTTIYLQANDPLYKQYIPHNLDTGLTAHTFGSGRIIILIDPTVPNWKKYLSKIIAHEYHHSVWVYRNFKTTEMSLIEYLILEGRADNFADLVYPDIISPWTNVMDLKTEKRVWAAIKKVQNSKAEDVYMRFLMGDKDIPFASTYTIGYRIVKEYLKNNPEVSLLEWTDMDVEEMLFKSKYEEKFKGLD